jgi:hypothetical protein
VVLTGAVPIVGEPDRSLPNPAFELKMAALIVAVGLRLAFGCMRALVGLPPLLLRCKIIGWTSGDSEKSPAECTAYH